MDLCSVVPRRAGSADSAAAASLRLAQQSPSSHPPAMPASTLVEDVCAPSLLFRGHSFSRLVRGGRRAAQSVTDSAATSACFAPIAQERQQSSMADHLAEPPRADELCLPSSPRAQPLPPPLPQLPLPPPPCSPRGSSREPDATIDVCSSPCPPTPPHGLRGKGQQRKQQPSPSLTRREFGAPGPHGASTANHARPPKTPLQTPMRQPRVPTPRPPTATKRVTPEAGAPSHHNTKCDACDPISVGDIANTKAVGGVPSNTPRSQATTSASLPHQPKTPSASSASRPLRPWRATGPTELLSAPPPPLPKTPAKPAAPVVLPLGPTEMLRRVLASAEAAARQQREEHTTALALGKRPLITTAAPQAVSKQ